MGRRKRKTKQRAAEAIVGAHAPSSREVVEVSMLPQASGFITKYDDGDKFFGGFGETQLLTADYWTLRQRSAQLFETNLYARGLIRRLITNEINTGLHLEAQPEEAILGLEEDSLAEWTEDVENRFGLWERDPWLCDHAEMHSFGALQSIARMESLIVGDVLVMMRQNRATGTPRIQLINGSSVRTPPGARVRAGHRVTHGVEIDPQGRHVAFWVTQADGTSLRVPAYGERSGRRLAWLVYGTDRRLDDVRGKPILSLILQSLREIDRYRDSAQRKAVLNSMLAMFVSKSEERAGTRPLTAGAVRRDSVVANDGSAGQSPRRFAVAEHIPGLVLDELQVGEEPKAFPSNGTDERFGVFEESIIQAVAWANEIPPEILRLSFSSNYSASQAAINEFKMYLNKVRTSFGNAFCQPIYVEWLVAAALARKINAPGLLEAWRSSRLYDEFGAWSSADWSGHIKPAVDMSKLVRGYDALIASGLITRDRAARELTGMKFSKIAKQLNRENEALAIALEPLTRDRSTAAQPSSPVRSVARSTKEARLHVADSQ